MSNAPEPTPSTVPTIHAALVITPPRIRIFRRDTAAALVQRPDKGGQTNPASTDHKYVVARPDLGAVDTMQADGEWLHQGRIVRG